MLTLLFQCPEAVDVLRPYTDALYPTGRTKPRTHQALANRPPHS